MDCCNLHILNDKSFGLKEPFLDRRDVLRSLAAGTVVLIPTGCVTNTETGRTQFIAVPDGFLAQQSLAAWSDLRKQQRTINSGPQFNRLNSVARRVQDASGRGAEQWEYALFDTDEANAFVLPGGKVGFNRGLMELSENDDQMAAVLGHEVGHVTGRHAAERMSTTLAVQGATVAGAVALANTNLAFKNELAAALGVGVQVGILLPFSRRDEIEADKLGVDYMHKAGYDVRQSMRLWEIMGARSSGNRQPQWLSTHPSPETRIRELREYINLKGYAVV